MKFFKWEYEPGGMCPVQAEGYFLGHYFYFRSRWSNATIEFSKTREDWDANRNIRFYRLKSYPIPEAGYIPRKEAKRLIYKGLLLFFLRWPDDK